MRTRREFKRTIAILAVLLIISAVLNVALMVNIIKLRSNAERGEQPTGSSDATPADAEMSETPPFPDETVDTTQPNEATPTVTPTIEPTPVQTPSPTPTPAVTPSPSPTPKMSPKATKRPNATVEPTPTVSGWVYSSAVPQNTETPTLEAPDTTEKEPDMGTLGNPFGGD